MHIASRIDHTLLKAEATGAQIKALAEEAIELGFASVCVNGRFVTEVSRLLAGSSLVCCAVAGFPLGAGKSTVKAIEATSAVKDGAREIDFVASLPPLLAGDLEAARNEWRELVRAVRSVHPEVGVKVIIESALLMRDVSGTEAERRIEIACRAARQSGCDFVKTSSGFHPAGGASEAAVRLMKKHSGGLGVKAAGGIRTRAEAEAMLAAGADRLGCSAGRAIVAGGEGF